MTGEIGQAWLNMISTFQLEPRLLASTGFHSGWTYISLQLWSAQIHKETRLLYYAYQQIQPMLYKVSTSHWGAELTKLIYFILSSWCPGLLTIQAGLWGGDGGALSVNMSKISRGEFLRHQRPWKKAFTPENVRKSFLKWQEPGSNRSKITPDKLAPSKGLAIQGMPKIIPTSTY